MRSNPPRPPMSPLADPFTAMVQIVDAVQIVGVNLLIAVSEAPWKIASPMFQGAWPQAPTNPTELLEEKE